MLSSRALRASANSLGVMQNLVRVRELVMEDRALEDVVTRLQNMQQLVSAPGPELTAAQRVAVVDRLQSLRDEIVQIATDRLGGREQLRVYLVPANSGASSTVVCEVQVPAPGPPVGYTPIATAQGEAAPVADPNADLKALAVETQRALADIAARRSVLANEFAFTRSNPGLNPASARALVATIARGALGVDGVHGKLDAGAVASLLDRQPAPGREISKPLEDPATKKWR